MTDERPRATYTHGHSQTTVELLTSRQADREGAFSLSRLYAGMRVADVGFGPGTITIGFASAVGPGEILGIDRESPMIEQARALAKEQGITNVRLGVCQAEDLPAADESYDAELASKRDDRLVDLL